MTNPGLLKKFSLVNIYRKLDVAIFFIIHYQSIAGKREIYSECTMVREGRKEGRGELPSEVLMT